MAGLVPAIHEFQARVCVEIVGARHKAGHDELSGFVQERPAR